MPNYQVVRCANDQCAKFQSQQQKKANKWSCVVCGLKQSLKRVYFESTTPKECRQTVMELNMQRGKAQVAREQIKQAAEQQPFPASVYSIDDNTAEREASRWTRFDDESKGSEVDNAVDDDLPQDKYNRIVVGQVEKQQKRKAFGRQPVNSVHKVQAEAPARYSPYPKTTAAKPALRREQSPPKNTPSAAAAAAAPLLPKAKVPVLSKVLVASNVPVIEEGASKWGQFAGSDSDIDSS
ncbi:hypothetical protein LPJ74_004049 [Coemansia sp. RSA 1843]|nr:hypothetical protein LPJ74_004049 [Coemansia sp. RSA 1843]